ncbi:MAG: hypothetical protein E7076_02195 [Bacteroidales bacterium]|nr:hypothetical protein [Bacteroidales bacterium]
MNSQLLLYLALHCRQKPSDGTIYDARRCAKSAWGASSHGENWRRMIYPFLCSSSHMTALHGSGS